MTTNVSVHDWTPADYVVPPDKVAVAAAEGRAEGLREAWHILVQVSQNGGTLGEAIQSVHWRWCEAGSAV